MVAGHPVSGIAERSSLGWATLVRVESDEEELVSVWRVSRFIRWVCFPGLGGAPLVVFLAASSSLNPAQLAWWLVFLVPWVYLSYRCWFRPFVKADPSGLTIGNPFSTRKLSWSEV